MRVLMLLFKDIHYDARVKREAQALAQAGHEVVIACLKEYDHDPPHLGEGVTLWRYVLSTKRIKRSVTRGKKTGGDGQAAAPSQGALPWLVRLARLPIVKLVKDIWASVEFGRKVAQSLARYRVDVIHCHDLNTLPQGYWLARRFKTRLVYDSHELFNEMAGKNWLERKLGYLVEGWLIKNIDHLIVVNPHVKKWFMRRYGPMPITVVQNTPILPDLTQPAPPEIPDLRQRYGLKEEDVLLLYQGGINPERGLEECLEAVALLPDRFKLVLIGEGRLKESLMAQVKERGLEGRVFFHPQVPSEHLLWYTRQADIGLVMYKGTSLNNYYSTPNKIFEYLLAGVPTVCSDHPGKSYIVREEETGLCVEETPEAIRDGILQVLADLDRYKENCLRKRERFTWQHEQVHLVHLYRQLGAYAHEQSAHR